MSRPRWFARWPLGPGDWRLRDSQLFLALTIVIGVLAGLSAVLFALSIDAASHLLFGLEPGPARLVLVPTLVSIVTGLLLSTWFNDARGSGVPQTKAAYHLNQGVIRPRVPLGKFVTGVLCIGSGHSMGREGPSVQIGAGLASAVGQWLRLPADRVKSLVPVGASAALAAAFNTPVAAVLFALEEIIADLNATLLGSTVIASVAAVIVARSLLGNEPLFQVPEYELQHPLELVAYLVLGIVGGLASVAFSKGLLGARGYFLKWPAWTRRWQPAIGGLAIGGILLVYPQVAGVGYSNIDQALNGGMVVTAMIALALVKGGATIVSYSTGNAGGIFAPSLFLGAMVGGAVGFAVQAVAPLVGVPVGEPGAYALVGMGTLFAGIIRAPLTSVFMIFEITQDYQIVVPLMVANMISLFISRRYQKQPVYQALLAQDGVELPGSRAQAGAGGWRAGNVMRTDIDALFVDPATPISRALLQAESAGADGLFAGKRDACVGIVLRDALARASAEGRGDEAVGALVGDEKIHVHADHAIDVVLDRFGQCAGGLLPVLGRANVRQVKGVITHETLLGVFGARRLARERPPPEG